MNKVLRFGLLLFLLFFDLPVKAQPNGDVFDINKAYLTGFVGHSQSRVNFVDETANIERRLGRSDSTFLYEEAAVSTIHYGGVTFIAYDSTSFVQEIDFSANKDLKLVLDKIELSYKTTLSEFSRLFPNSYRDGQASENPETRYYELSPNERRSYVRLLLFFNNEGTLSSLKYSVG